MADLFECLDDLGRELSEKMDDIAQKAVEMSEIRSYNRQIRELKRETQKYFRRLVKESMKNIWIRKVWITILQPYVLSYGEKKSLFIPM